jgi:hypothetical protein
MDDRLNYLPDRWLNEPEALLVALKLDMMHYWQPTAEGYFGRVSKGPILEAVREGIGPGAAQRWGNAWSSWLSWLPTSQKELAISSS